MTTPARSMPSDYVGARLREVRRRRGWSAADLAARCAELGAPQLTGSVINDIETGRPQGGVRRRLVAVEELLTLALALNAPPLWLIIPPDDPDQPYPVTPAETETRRNVAAWFTGTGPILPRLPLVGDTRKFYAELPEEQFRRMTQREEG